MPVAHVVIVVLSGDPHLAVTSAIGWLFMVGFGVLRFRRYRAGTLEREALAELRIAHARRTGDLTVLLEAAEERHRRPTPGPPSGRRSSAGTVAPQPSREL